MNKNRILNIISIVSCALTFGVMGAFCITTGLAFKQRNSVDFSIEEKDETSVLLKTKFEIHKGDIIEYSKVNGSYRNLNNQVVEYSEKISSNLKIGEMFNENDCLYDNGSASLYAENPGVVINAKDDSFCVYYFNMFEFSVSLTSNEYYSIKDRNNFYAKINGNYYNLKFLNNDLSNASSTGQFKINFSSDNIMEIVTKESFEGVFELVGKHLNAFYIEPKLFNDFATNFVYFAYLKDEKIDFALIECKELIDNKAIISSDELDLNTIEYLYDYE